MRTRLALWIENALVGAIALLFILPLSRPIVSNNQKLFRHWPVLGHPWFTNRTLQGTTLAVSAVPFSWSALATGEFQRSAAARFNEQFAGREAFIRWTSEVWFRLFHETASPASDVAIGPRDVLFEKGYLKEYFLERTSKETLAPWVEKLRQLQDVCRQRGIGFVVVVSPSKVALQLEETPLAWRRYYDPRPRGYVQLLELFREHGILFVDAHALLEAERSTSALPAPLFPKGGVHWNPRGVALVANAILRELQAQGQPLQPFEWTGGVVSMQPKDPDDDLLRLMNLARPWAYPCEQITIRPDTRLANEKQKMTVVGGSFSWSLIKQLSATGEFSEVDFFYYYRLSKSRAVNGELVKVRAPAAPLDFEREIFGADSLVLELNESSAPYSEHHLSAFVGDALAR